MNRWQYRPVPFKFQLSDWTLFSVSLRMQVRAANSIGDTHAMEAPIPPSDELMEGSQGFLIRGQPIVTKLPAVSRIGNYLCYIPLQYQHCYIDLHISYESYWNKFSSKTKSTLNRKVRKYAEHCGGTIPWKTYKMPVEMRDFFRLAGAVSKLTYQERLLDAGLPDTEDFIVQAELLAANQRVRAYILFDGEQPVSYLYCPVHEDILIYSYLGYAPSYLQMSVGTVLQLLAIEQLFAEARFRYFDFTEGQSDHKRLFATHQRQCANVFLVKGTFRNMALIYSQLMMNRFSTWLGITLDKLGVKAKLKRLMRFSG